MTEEKDKKEAEETTESKTAPTSPEGESESKPEGVGKANETEVETETEVPAEFKDLVEKIEKMTVMELNSLVKLLEKKFGVSAQAVAVAQPSGGDSASGEEQSTFTVELKSAGDSKIGVIKAVKSALGLGLKEAKDLVDAAPSVLKEGMKREEAEALKKEVEEAGGLVELK